MDLEFDIWQFEFMRIKGLIRKNPSSHRKTFHERPYENERKSNKPSIANAVKVCDGKANWSKIYALSKFLSLAKSLSEQEPANLLIGNR